MHTVHSISTAIFKQIFINCYSAQDTFGYTLPTYTKHHDNIWSGSQADFYIWIPILLSNVMDMLRRLINCHIIIIIIIIIIDIGIIKSSARPIFGRNSYSSGRIILQ